MKVVINDCFGGFSLSKDAADCLGLNTCYPDNDVMNDIRSDPRLIGMVKEDSKKASGRSAELKVVEFPDEATDWEVDEYDGNESVTYVLDGKLYHVC